MRIKIVSVGKLKENFAKEWVKEYEKRLQNPYKTETVEIKEGKTLKDEAKKIAGILRNCYLIALDKGGKQITSEGFAQLIKEHLFEKEIVFLIGSDKGLDEDVLNKADQIISFSAMTFSHQLARVLLMEQIYRAYTIIHRMPYPK